MHHPGINHRDYQFQWNLKKIIKNSLAEPVTVLRPPPTPIQTPLTPEAPSPFSFEQPISLEKRFDSFEIDMWGEIGDILQQMNSMKAEMEAMKKENQVLKKN